MIKILNKLGTEGYFLCLIKSTYKKPTQWKTRCFPHKIRNKTKTSALTYIQHCTRCSSHCKLQKNEMKFPDDMILYKENPSESTRKLLGLVQQVCRIQDPYTKIKLFYTLAMSNLKMNRKIPFTITSTRIKYCRINLKEIQTYSLITIKFYRKKLKKI